MGARKGPQSSLLDGVDGISGGGGNMGNGAREQGAEGECEPHGSQV
jgi:hypothetical protein